MFCFLNSSVDKRDILPFLHYMTFQTTQTKYFLKAYDTHYPLTHQPATYHPFWPIRPETQNQPNLTFYPLYSVFYVNEHIYQGWRGGAFSSQA